MSKINPFQRKAESSSREQLYIGGLFVSWCRMAKRCMTATHTSHTMVLGYSWMWTAGLLFVTNWSLFCKPSGPCRGHLEQHNRNRSVCFPQCPLTCCKDQEEEEWEFLSISVKAVFVHSSPSCQNPKALPCPQTTTSEGKAEDSSSNNLGSTQAVSYSLCYCSACSIKP